MIEYSQLQCLVSKQMVEWEDESASWHASALRLLFGLMPLTACPGAIDKPIEEFLTIGNLIDVCNSRELPLRFSTACLKAYLIGVPGLVTDQASFIHIRSNVLARHHHGQVLLFSGLSMIIPASEVSAGQILQSPAVA